MYQAHKPAPRSTETSIIGVIRPPEENRDPLSDSARAQDNWFVAMDANEIGKFMKEDISLIVDQIASNPLSNSMQQPTLEEPLMVEKHDHLLFYVLPSTHVGYMVTWYGLCAWIVGTGLYMRKRRR